MDTKQENKFIITEEDKSHLWFNNIPETPDSWTLGEMYGEYLDFQDMMIENQVAKINYAHDLHTYPDGTEFDLCPWDGLFGRF